jgi:dTMP kinase
LWFDWYPDRTTAIGGLIDSYLKRGVDLDDRALHLLYSANRWEREHTIADKLASGIIITTNNRKEPNNATNTIQHAKPRLAGHHYGFSLSTTAGTTLIVDRYAHSGVAFSAAKGLDIEWCKLADTGLPAPDAVLYLHLSIEEAGKRGGFGEERFEKVAFQKIVKSLYEEKLKDESWKLIDANKDKEALHRDIREIACNVINQVKTTNPPLKALWNKK